MDFVSFWSYILKNLKKPTCKMCQNVFWVIFYLINVLERNKLIQRLSSPNPWKPSDSALTSDFQSWGTKLEFALRASSTKLSEINQLYYWWRSCQRPTWTWTREVFKGQWPWPLTLHQQNLHVLVSQRSGRCLKNISQGICEISHL